MIKAFILVLIFESGPNLIGIHNVEFSSRQTCESARITIQAKAKQQVRTTQDGKKIEALKLIDTACLEK
ncbi:hypothetical protein LOD59_10745 [Xylella fastidiosa subsp. multiplex]|uniref:hypothetical protein n=1 Tax=Xylella fastidiosa TaxID=2371 RepID=UPI00235E93CD|nr:hypothetical protein [Xylella fastidiosa]MDD0928091.1 hypothetical protein [Xylella fastidiosa subsp. multiplex]